MGGVSGRRAWREGGRGMSTSGHDIAAAPVVEVSAARGRREEGTSGFASVRIRRLTDREARTDTIERSTSRAGRIRRLVD